MIRPYSLFACLVLLSAGSALTLPASSDPPAKTDLFSTTLRPAQAKTGSIAADLGRLPLAFEHNEGQADAQVSFLTHYGDSTLFLTPSEAVFSIAERPQQQERHALAKDLKACRPTDKNALAVVRMQMVGSNPGASLVRQQPLPGRINYIRGRDPHQWHTGVATFGRVGFQGVYPGVDLVYYGNQGRLEYDFIVAPHADPYKIRLHFAGAHGVRVSAAGDLMVRTQGRELKWQRLRVYQQGTTEQTSVAAHFQLTKLSGGQTDVRFALGHYDHSRPLVIDPVLVYSTYLGGSYSGNWPSAMALDSGGNVYVTGYTVSPDFPTTAGALQRGKNGRVGSESAYVTKLNATGTALVYSTYLDGYSSTGSLCESSGQAIAVDSSGNAYIVGSEYNETFPITPGAFQSTVANADGFGSFVTKLNATGAAIVYSTFLAGSSGRDQLNAIAVDSSGNAYITGEAASDDFPTTPGAFQPASRAIHGYSNAFVTKLNSTGTDLVYSTYLGGKGGLGGTGAGDVALGIAVDSSGSAYVTGLTFSYEFPTTPGAYQSGQVLPSSQRNAFVTKLNSTGTALLYSTYLGGNGQYGNQGNAIAVDSSGSAYVAGTTKSTSFPTTPGAFQRAKKAPPVEPTGFVTKLNPTGTALLYSTYLSGSVLEEAKGIAVDSSGNAYVSGYTDSLDFPTTQGAFQRVFNNQGTGNYSAFVTKFNPAGTALLYSTYLSGSNGNNVVGIALDSSNQVYVAGLTISTLYPTTPGAVQPHYQTTDGSPNAFATKLSAVPIFPDFNNDGNTDLLIQNTSTGQIASWFMHGPTWTGGAYFSLMPPTEYALVGAGDFSGDGNITLVLQSRTSNQVAFWYTSGTNHATIPGGDFVNTIPPAGWKVVSVGDFNSDGKSDLVLQNQNVNQVAIWFMNGYLYQGGVLMPYTPPTGWTVAGAGDFNGDGFADLIFQNQTTGQIALWYMNGPTYTGGIVLTTAPATGWKIVGVGDYNGDGSADLLFQNQTNNQAAVWYLKNGAYVGGNVLSLAPPSGWKIVGPR